MGEARGTGVAFVGVDKAVFCPSMDSFLGALKGVLAAHHVARSPEDLWGFSGLAFRTQVHRTLNPAGLFLRQWDETYPRIVRRLGFDCFSGLRDFYYTEDDLPQLQRGWMGNIERHLGDGLPAIAYGLHGPAFGIINGFDDVTENYRVSTFLDGQLDGPVNAQDLGSHHPPRIFVLIVTSRLEKHDPRAALLEVLRETAAHGTGAERDAKGQPVEVPADLALGGDAFDAWIQALAARNVAPHWGAAVTAGYHLEARALGAAFLRGTAKALLPKHAGALDEAAAHLEREAALLQGVARLFPAAEAHTLDDPQRRLDAAHALTAAKAEHAAALAKLAALVTETP